MDLAHFTYSVLFLFSCSKTGTGGLKPSRDHLSAESIFVPPCRLSKSGVLDCSFKQLKHVPKIPIECTVANISNNYIERVQSPVFRGLIYLHTIDISDNPLSYLSEDTFSGLANLKELYIRNSLLYNQEGLKINTLLRNCIPLEHFSFTFHYYRQACPAQCNPQHVKNILGDQAALSSIKSLEIDSLLLPRTNDTSTCTGYKTLTLELVNGLLCFYNHFEKQHFAYMPHLERLYIKDLYGRATFSDEAFSRLSNLRVLSIQGDAPPCSPPKQAEVIFHNITKSIVEAVHIQTLQIDNVVGQKGSSINCKGAFFQMTDHTLLQSVSLRHNALNGLNDCHFPKSVRSLYLGYNCVWYQQLIKEVFHNNAQIEFVFAGYQGNCLSDQSERQFRNQHLPSSTEPSNLKILIFTHSNYLEYFYKRFHPVLEHLQHLDFSDTTHLYISKEFSSLFPNIEYLDLTSCRLSTIQKNCFRNFTTLRRLYLSFNALGKMADELFERLHHLSFLEELKLDNNQIYKIPGGAFNSMHSLRVLHIGHNNIHKLDVSFKSLEKLQLLNLSYNQIMDLSNADMDDFDMIAKHRQLKLDLSGNNLQCNCDTIQMMHWMAETRVKLQNIANYRCVYSKGNVEAIGELSATVEHLDKSCKSKLVLIIVTCVVGTLVLTLIISGIVYKNRWKLRYLYNMAKIRLQRNRGNHNVYDRIFDYDAFISYASDDFDVARSNAIAQLEVERGLRLCIHERDFLPGEYIAFNISKCIHSSRRTLAFISGAFLESEWCTYELNIARMESIHTGRKVILVVLLEKVDTRRLPLEVLDIVRTQTYIEYPASGNEQDLDLFWSKCYNFITGM